eukprot:gene247-864_t
MAENISTGDCWTRTMMLTTMLKTNLALSVCLNIAQALICIIGNLAFIITLFKTRSLHTPSNVLLGAMCISDLFIGFLAHPLFLAYLIQMQNGDDYSEYRLVRKLYIHIFSTCAGLSFLFASLISVDRYFAICHPFKYELTVSCKKYILASIATVAFSVTCTFAALHPQLKQINLYEILTAVPTVFTYFTVLICYAKIYRVIYKQRKAEVIPLGTIAGTSDEQRDKEQKTQQQTKERYRRTNTIGIILAGLLLCYAPIFSLSVYVLMQGGKICKEFEKIFIIYVWISLLVFANSSINPIVYFLRSRGLRKAAWKVFKSWFKT